MELLDRLQPALADRYRIERELGRGGMATVYLAEDLKHGRRVALKVLRPELGAALGGDRFLREIETSARLQHPHILPLHRFGRSRGGPPAFYAMPYVEGESLRGTARPGGAAPLDEAVAIAREVADALDYAHAAGVRAPGHQAREHPARRRTRMVADFGIARALDAAGGDRLTETGLALGTPHYMSPEQASAERECWTAGAISTRSAACSTRCSPANRLSMARPRKRSWPGTRWIRCRVSVRSERQ